MARWGIHDPRKVVNRDALAQPDSIEWCITFSAQYLAQCDDANDVATAENSITAPP